MNTLHTTLKYTVLGGIFLTLLTPFIVTSSMFFPFITGKAFFFRIVVEIIFAAWLILALRDPQYRPQKSWLLYAYSAFMAALVLSTIFAINPEKSFWSNFERMEGLVTHLHLFAYFSVLISMVKTKQLWETFLNSALVIGLVQAAYAALQVVGKAEIHQGSDRLSGTLGNADYLAVFALFQIFIAGYFFVKHYIAKQSRWMLYAAVAFINFLVLFGTGTRMAIGALYLGLFVSAGILGWRMRGSLRKVSLIFLAVLIVVPVVFMSVRHTSVVQENVTMRRLADTVDNWEGAISSRRYLWPMSWQGFKENPLLGWGPDNYNIVFNKFYDPHLWPQEKWFDRSHNVFLDWLITGGILGLVTYLSLFGIAFYYLYRLGRSDGRSGSNLEGAGTTAVFGGLLVAYFAQNLTVFDNLISYVFFFTILAWLHTQMAGTTPPLFKKTVSASTLSVSTAVIAVLAIIIIYGVNAKPITAAKGLIWAMQPHVSVGAEGNMDKFKEIIALDTFGTPEIREQLMSFAANIARANVPEEFKSTAVALALGELEQQITETPYDARYSYIIAVHEGNYGQFDKAIEHLKLAIEHSPRKQDIHISLASVYIQKKDYQAALATAKQAYDFDPMYNNARNAYVAAAIFVGDKALVNSLIGNTPIAEIAQDDLVLNAYVVTRDYTKVNAIWDYRIARDPKNPQNHLSLAATYLAMGERARAIAQIQQAIKLNPDLKAQGQYYIQQIQAGKNP